MRVIQDDIWLCTDCTLAAVNDDYSSLDYYYGASEAAAKEQTIRQGLTALGPDLVSDWDGEETQDGILEFSRIACGCCKTTLAGERHRFAVLGN